MKVGKCEKNLKKARAILADSVEAVIGAIYLDGGYSNAKKFVLKNLPKYVGEYEEGLGVKDYKTLLQEELQKTPNCTIKYVVTKEEGPEHAKTFYVNVLYNDNMLGSGNGRSKKEAEQQAANEALRKIGYEK